MEKNNRPRTSPKVLGSGMKLWVTVTAESLARDAAKLSKLSHVSPRRTRVVGALVTERGPENTDGASDSGDTGDADGLGLFESVVISPQDGLMQESSH